jgi:hypothetical protein
VDVQTTMRGVRSGPLFLSSSAVERHTVKARVSFPAKGEPKVEHVCWVPEK